MNHNLSPEAESQQVRVEQSAESQPEAAKEQGIETESNAILGAQLLEEPQSGSFASALQALVAWVKNLTQ